MKFKILILQLVVFLSTTPLVHSSKISELFGSIVSHSKHINHAIVPTSRGEMQSVKNFTLRFSGQEDPTTVRIALSPSKDHYTVRETLSYLFFGREAASSVLSGTVTPHGVLTNAHGFYEEIPSLRNKIFNLIRRKKLYYRPLLPVKIEQGLTLKYFETDKDDLFYYKIDSTQQETIHKVYTEKDIKEIFIAKPYVESLIPMKLGVYFGKPNPLYDLALIKYEDGHKPLHICQIAKEIPSAEIVKVRIYQYPEGHPLQKMSEEYAHFACAKHPYCYTFICDTRSSCSAKHYCITLPGSSGSSLRDWDSGEIIGVHRGGYAPNPNKEKEEEAKKGYNSFVPINESLVKSIDYKIYPQKEVDLKKE